MNNVWKSAIINSVATAAYVIGVACFLYFGTLIKLGRVNTILAPITLLLLLVFSAALTGFLIFGKPAQLYVDGKKKEALSLLTYTLIIFSIITFLALVSLIVFAR
ncbi:MAG TPA: hypothetical protein VMR59_04225 [Patescibacteria group bacterium]|jgi:hypothetical protein|nr:hypothetical protein [Patescibacteria group bacterium]